MSTRIILIIFGIVFSLGILAVVILPFVLGGGPPEEARLARGGPSAPVAEAPGAAAGKATPPDRGVFRSDDGGRTWEAKSLTPDNASIAGFTVNRLIAHPTDAATLFLATDGNGLWVSHDRGDHWAPVLDAARVLDAHANVLALAVNPDDPAEWYVAVFQAKRGRVLMSADGGQIFREIYFTPVERFGVFDLFFDRARRSIVIATGQGGLLESADRGVTWRVARWFADGLTRLLVDPSSPDIRYVATSRGALFRTRDGGTAWADVSGAFDSFSGSRKEQVWEIDASGAVYLGSRHGLLRSRDNAGAFEGPPLIIPPDVLPVLAVAVDTHSPLRLIVSAASEIYASINRGESWAILSSPSVNRVTRLLFDREHPATIYAVVEP